MTGVITKETRVPLGLAGGVAVALLSVVVWVYGTTSGQSVAVTEIRARCEAVSEAASRNERSITEARNEAKANGVGMESKLMRIEDKLDRLIERLGARPPR